MSHLREIQTSYQRSTSAWESWYLSDVEQRCALVSSFIESLPAELQNAANYQLLHSQPAIMQVHDLVGPTGETNELYTAGRGVSLLIVESKRGKSIQATVAMLVAIVAAGNSVIICCDDATIAKALLDQDGNSRVLGDVIQCVSFDSHKILVDHDIRNCAFIGNWKTEREINTLLANRTGAITALVSETDLVGLPVSQDPTLVLRFITERTRTINITAVGGNATLLELGSETR
jgi:delta 1-pyrroline-5-carboxylate dehydrogenase